MPPSNVLATIVVLLIALGFIFYAIWSRWRGEGRFDLRKGRLPLETSLEPFEDGEVEATLEAARAQVAQNREATAAWRPAPRREQRLYLRLDWELRPDEFGRAHDALERAGVGRLSYESDIVDRATRERRH